jgi:hypothetical protein
VRWRANEPASRSNDMSYFEGAATAILAIAAQALAVAVIVAL